MSDKIGAVILAAGRGTRMKLDMPKPLVPLAGRKLIDYPLRALESLPAGLSLELSITVVTGYQRGLVEEHLSNRESDLPCSYVFQKEQKGTGDALREYFNSQPDAANKEYTLVVCADTPLVDKDIFMSLIQTAKQQRLDAVCASFTTNNPYGYGRIVKKEGERGFFIVEEKDASDEVKQINEVNSGLYLMRTKYVLDHLDKLDDKNAAGEFYLTDVFKSGQNVQALCFDNASQFLGINDLEQLQRAERLVRIKKMRALLAKGVRLIDLNHTYIDDPVEIGEGSVVYPNSFILGTTRIGNDSTIEMGVVIKDSQIESGAKILGSSYIESAVLGENCSVGPFARLREGTRAEDDVKLGNFVETKKSTFAKGAKVSHLSYVGDAKIGERTNIGCGFITCNYDGADKHETIIGSDCFIGSDSQTIAPVEIGDRCFVASGSTINKSLKSDSFAIARAKQETKEGMAKKFLKKPLKT